MSVSTPALLASMTGFGRSAGIACGRAWAWELRSVNARGLDLRLRLPPGWDGQEPALRAAAMAAFRRGTIQATLNLAADAGAGVTVRTDVLDRLVALAVELADRIPGALPPRAEALLAMPGVIRTGEDRDPAELAPAILAGLHAALADLASSRLAEGARLHAVLAGLLDDIASLTRQAAAAAAELPDAQRRRLTDAIALILGVAGGPIPGLGEDRLAAELALIASRADVTEELDRLDSHLAAARALLADGTAVGRRLDFLVQEFAREANTLCAKAGSSRITTIGLALKASLEQLREQVQNIE